MNAAPLADAPCADGSAGCKTLAVTIENAHAKASVTPGELTARLSNGDHRFMEAVKEDRAKTIGPGSSGTLSFLLPADHGFVQVAFRSTDLVVDIPAA